MTNSLINIVFFVLMAIKMNNSQSFLYKSIYEAVKYNANKLILRNLEFYIDELRIKTEVIAYVYNHYGVEIAMALRKSYYARYFASEFIWKKMNKGNCWHGRTTNNFFNGGVVAFKAFFPTNCIKAIYVMTGIEELASKLHEKSDHLLNTIVDALAAINVDSSKLNKKFDSFLIKIGEGKSKNAGLNEDIEFPKFSNNLHINRANILLLLNALCELKRNINGFTLEQIALNGNIISYINAIQNEIKNILPQLHQFYVSSFSAAGDIKLSFSIRGHDKCIDWTMDIDQGSLCSDIEF